MRGFAERLIACEAEGNASANTGNKGGFRVCDKIRVHLGTSLGVAGFRALLLRAFALAGTEVPSLLGVHLRPDGSLEDEDEVSAKLKPKELAEGGIVVVAQLLGLLAAFIGEGLMLRFLCEIWPQLSLGEMEFDEGNTNEE